MNSRIRRAIGIGVIGVLAGTTAAVATPPSGLTSQLLARGSWDRQDRRDFIESLEEKRKVASDVATVQATLALGGTTGWHAHPGPSVVVLKSGTLTITEATGRGCGISEVTAATGPKVFFHPEEVHKFDNTGGTIAELYITYFVPTAVPLLIDAPAPAPCTDEDDDDDE